VLNRAAKTSVVVSYDETDINNGPDSYVEVSPDVVYVPES